MHIYVDAVVHQRSSALILLRKVLQYTRDSTVNDRPCNKPLTINSPSLNWLPTRRVQSSRLTFACRWQNKGRLFIVLAIRQTAHNRCSLYRKSTSELADMACLVKHCRGSNVLVRFHGGFKLEHALLDVYLCVNSYPRFCCVCVVLNNRYDLSIQKQKRSKKSDHIYSKESFKHENAENHVPLLYSVTPTQLPFGWKTPDARTHSV